MCNRKPVCRRWAAALLGLASAAAPLCGQREQVIQGKLRQRALYVMSEPFRLEVNPQVRSVAVKDRLPAEVRLLDAGNQPVNASNLVKVIVSLKGPSGKVRDTWITIPEGKSSAMAILVAEESGLNELSAQEEKNRLRGGKNTVLVVPKKRVPQKPPPSGANGAHLNGGALAAPLPPAAQAAHLEWQVQCPNEDGCLANETDPAHIQIFYVTEDGSGAPRPIHVWLTWNHGRLEPNPVVIPQGQNFGQTWLRSRHPLEAKVRLVTSSPRLPVEGLKEQSVVFTTAIAGPHPSGTERMSLVERGRLIVHFFDFDGNVVPTGVDRSVVFTSRTASLRVQPADAVVKKGRSFTSAELLPGGVGIAKVTVSTDYYRPVDWTVEVSWQALLWFWLGGGLVGTLASLRSIHKLREWSGVRRVLAGLVGAFLLTCAYVYFGVPNLTWDIAHNNISVLPVSLVGGYLGTKAIDWFAKVVLGQGAPAAAK